MKLVWFANKIFSYFSSHCIGFLCSVLAESSQHLASFENEQRENHHREDTCKYAGSFRGFICKGQLMFKEGRSILLLYCLGACSPWTASSLLHRTINSKSCPCNLTCSPPKKNPKPHKTPKAKPPPSCLNMMFNIAKVQTSPSSFPMPRPQLGDAVGINRGGAQRQPQLISKDLSDTNLSVPGFFLGYYPTLSCSKWISANLNTDAMLCPQIPARPCCPPPCKHHRLLLKQRHHLHHFFPELKNLPPFPGRVTSHTAMDLRGSAHFWLASMIVLSLL